MSIVILLIIIISLVEYIGDSNFKHYARNNLNYSNLLVGSIAYIIIICLLIIALKYTNLIFVNGNWDGISAIIGTILAFILLKERLKSPIQYTGLFLIISGIFALNAGPTPY
jgi:multidrug transporter EmrE-like cation transporter